MVQPLDPRVIKKLEELFETELSSSFKSFLEIMNQGLGSYEMQCPPPQEYAVFNMKFFEFGSNWNIFEMISDLREYAHIPHYLLPFAGGNELFCFLDLSSPTGRIVVGECLRELEDQSFEYMEILPESIQEVAADIEEFIEKIRRL